MLVGEVVANDNNRGSNCGLFMVVWLLVLWGEFGNQSAEIALVMMRMMCGVC